MAGIALAIDLPRRDSGKPDPGALSTPDRTIAIPDAGWGAGEAGARRDDGGEDKQHSRDQDFKPLATFGA